MQSCTTIDSMNTRNWYVKHKNPKIEATGYGEYWTLDGPHTESEAHQEVVRCGYEACGIPYEVVRIEDLGLPELIETEEEE